MCSEQIGLLAFAMVLIIASAAIVAYAVVELIREIAR